MCAPTFAECASKPGVVTSACAPLGTLSVTLSESVNDSDLQPEGIGSARGVLIACTRSSAYPFNGVPLLAARVAVAPSFGNDIENVPENVFIPIFWDFFIW